jgi:hypothetical protein
VYERDSQSSGGEVDLCYMANCDVPAYLGNGVECNIPRYVGETPGHSGGVKDHRIPRAVTHYRITLAGLLQLKWKTKNRVCVPIL